MLRGDNVICGTSTTGTGALTLAACPSPPGGIDLYTWLTTSTGMGFVNGNSVICSYTLIEYTDSSFANQKQLEKGVGTASIGASLTATTLARTTIQETITGMNTSSPVLTFAAGTGVSVGVAANTLVFIGNSVMDQYGIAPYNGTAGDNTGVFPFCCSSGGMSASNALTNQQHWYVPFIWAAPLLAKRITFKCAGSVGGTSNLYARIYAKGTDGRPGKLLYDFGSCGSNCLGALGLISAIQGNGIMMYPGEYWLDILPTFTGGAPGLSASGQPTAFFISSGFLGGTNMCPYTGFAAGSDSATVGPDPAFLTNWQPWPTASPHGSSSQHAFTLASS